MARLFQSLRISVAISLLVGAALLGIIASLGVTGSVVNAFQSATVTTAEWQAAASSGDELQIDLLQLRRHEKDFLLRSDAKYLQKHQDASQAAVADSAKLRKAFLALDPASESTFDTIDADLGRYIEAFAALARTRTAMGLTKDEGFEGGLRAAVRGIEEKIKSVGNLKLRVAMLEIRRSEKDYMLRRDDEYRAAALEKAGALKAAIQAENMGSVVPADLLDTYVTAFTAWADASKQMASEQAILSDAYARLELGVDTVVGRAIEGARAVAVEMDAVAARAWIEMVVAGAVIVLVLVVFGSGIGRTISRAVVGTAAVATSLANGHRGLAIGGGELSNEIGSLSRALATLQTNLMEAEAQQARQAEIEAADRARLDRRNAIAQSFVSSMAQMSARFAGASSELSTAARDLSATAEETSRQAQAVSGSAEEASANVQTVASSVDELATSVREISVQVTHSATISQAAYAEAINSAERVRGLAEAATAIGDVVVLIKGIADQTNLLALNATIEAARAGETGRGFAVVAGEVKELATQTAKATDEISSKIHEIQQATSGTVKSIEEIVQRVSAVKTIASNIASAVEQQGAATSEIAASCQNVAIGTGAVTDTISGVGRAAETTGAASSQLMTLSGGLSAQAADLKRVVETFVRDLDAA